MGAALAKNKRHQLKTQPPSRLANSAHYGRLQAQRPDYRPGGRSHHHHHHLDGAADEPALMAAAEANERQRGRLRQAARQARLNSGGGMYAASSLDVLYGWCQDEGAALDEEELRFLEQGHRSSRHLGQLRPTERQVLLARPCCERALRRRRGPPPPHSQVDLLLQQTNHLYNKQPPPLVQYKTQPHQGGASLSRSSSSLLTCSESDDYYLDQQPFHLRHRRRPDRPAAEFPQQPVGRHLQHQLQAAKLANKRQAPPATAAATAAAAPVTSGSAHSSNSTALLSSRSTSTWSVLNKQHQHQQQNMTQPTTGNAHQLARQERGLALSQLDRERLGLVGLLPVAVRTQQQQVAAVMRYLEGCQDELAKYVYLRQLKDFNEHLFYASLVSNVGRLMPLVYTPTVGLACERFSEIYSRPRGLFVTLSQDAGRVAQVLARWPERDVRVIVLTDGERILGLGDLGAHGMGICIGKLSLYTALAGIPPQHVLPVCLDVGTNNERLLADPLYIGHRGARSRGPHYQRLVDEFMGAVVERFGRSCLIQFEDFGNSTAFELLERYRTNYCTFNDDIQGTAAVCLSGLISAARLGGRRLADCSFLFYGAGEANLGAAKLLMMALAEEGLGGGEALERVWLVDSRGLVVASRQDLSAHKRQFARRQVPHLSGLEEIVELARPTAIVGASAQPKAFTETVLAKMAAINERPIVFALSNPTSKAECTADEAFRFTQGRCVFASGSPFDPVTYNGKTILTGQGNNAYIFPAVGLAAIAAHLHSIPEETFLVAARALSDQLTSQDAQLGLVYPRLDSIREVTLKVACRVLEFFYAERLATFRPEPQDKETFLRGLQYDGAYESTTTNTDEAA